MAPSNLPPIFNATSQDIEMLLAAQCHLGSKNLQVSAIFVEHSKSCMYKTDSIKVHMDGYLWKTRPDGINIINIGKTWLGLQKNQ